MAEKALPCPTLVRLLLEYKPETGELFWRYRPRAFFADTGSWKKWNTRYVGTPALAYVNPNGYRMGVFRIKSGAWWAYIGSGPTRRTVGYFDKFEDACVARKAAEAAAGFHPGHGRKVG